MYKIASKNRKLRCALLLGAAAAISAPAYAQDQQGGIETIVVTGSLLSRSDVETPSPVTIVTSQQIQASGLTSTADVVRSLTSDNSGTIPTAFGIGFAAGSSGVALRGLTVNSTLVLINGRRTANYPLADDGERGFVDLNTIPLDAVDRVEVLKDGASSIYGADAIAGVVNIIMKDEFQGVAGEAEYGTSQQGGGTMNRLTATLGYGDMASDHFNAYVNLEYEKDDAIHVGQRPFPYNTADLSSIGGVDENSHTSIYGKVAPTLLSNPNDPTSSTGQLGNYQILAGNTGSGGTCGPKATQTDHVPNALGGIDTFCEQDTALYGDDQPKQERYGVYAHAKERFSNAATFYMDASYFENQVWIDSPFLPNTRTTAPVNTQNIALPAYLATGARNPNDPFVQKAACPAAGIEGVTNSLTCPDALIGYLFGDIPAKGYENNRVMRASVGLKGDWKGWNYDTAFVAAHAWLGSELAGFLNHNQLISDIEEGTYNFIDPSANTPAVRQALAPDLIKTSTTDEDSWDVRASHDVFALPGGEAQLGFSIEARHEATFDPDLNPGLNALGLGIAHTIGNRNIYSASAELGLPILTNLEVDLSGRFDHYSDFGDTFNPKIGVKWTPIQQVTLRGTYSTGFRAPSFSENGTAESEGFIVFNPCGSFPGFCAAHAGDEYTLPYALGILSTANPNIKPEKARNYTFGTILQPFTDIDLNGTVDYYNIQKTNVISPSSSGPALGAAFSGSPIPAGYTVQFDAPDPAHPAAPLRPVVVGAPYINAASLKTNGYDVNIHFGTDLWEGVHWTSEADWTQIMAYRFTVGNGCTEVVGTKTVPCVYSYVGTEAPYILSSGAGTPRDKGSWANTLTWAELSVTGTLYYTSGIAETGIDATGPTPGHEGAICSLGFGLYGPTAKKFCQVNAFWDFDMTARYHINDNVDVFGGLKNVFDQKPPLDAANYAGVNYNPTYAQDGIVGRFWSLGVSFKD